jgi:hypothetical protein
MLWNRIIGAGGFGGDSLFVGAVRGSGALSIPAHSAGDLIIAVDSDYETTSAPSTITGFTSAATYNNNILGSTFDVGSRLQYQFDAAGTISSVTLNGASGHIWVFTGIDSFVQTVSSTNSSGTPNSTWNIPELTGLTIGNFIFAGNTGSDDRNIVTPDTGWEGDVNGTGALGVWIENVESTTVAASGHGISDVIYDCHAVIEFSKTA